MWKLSSPTPVFSAYFCRALEVGKVFYLANFSEKSIRAECWAKNISFEPEMWWKHHFHCHKVICLKVVQDLLLQGETLLQSHGSKHSCRGQCNIILPWTLFQVAIAGDRGMEFWCASFCQWYFAGDKNNAYQDSVPWSFVVAKWRRVYGSSLVQHNQHAVDQC